MRAQTADFYEPLDPSARAAIGGSWAGGTTSLVWFDNARELTERWHDQEQIPLATNRPGIMTPPLYHTVLDTFLRGLPYAYRDVAAAVNTELPWCVSSAATTTPSAKEKHLLTTSTAERMFFL